MMILALAALVTLTIVLLIMLMKVILNQICRGGKKDRMARINGGIDIDDGENGYDEMHGYHGLSGETAYIRRRKKSQGILFLEDCVTKKQIRVPIGERETILGREARKGCVAISDSSFVSRRQCGVREEGRRLYIRHLGKNRTILNDQTLHLERPELLVSGDIIKIGNTRLRVLDIQYGTGKKRKHEKR